MPSSVAKRGAISMRFWLEIVAPLMPETPLRLPRPEFSNSILLLKQFENSVFISWQSSNKTFVSFDIAKSASLRSQLRKMQFSNTELRKLVRFKRQFSNMTCLKFPSGNCRPVNWQLVNWQRIIVERKLDTLLPTASVSTVSARST